ncbi:MAG: hypothetical protein PHU44_13015 [Syntrophales bacterium]|nr:hypothetical protein [Syntrophales bacterium]MDD5642746.1 hypothetical protein [Syntrophales bacterium]
MALDQERKKALDEALEKIEAIGFFAAIGMHFADSTPLLSEDLGDCVKGAPWERFSSTDQCLKMIHKLAAEVWNSLERVSSCVEPQIGNEEVPATGILKPADSRVVTTIPSYFQTIAGELRFLKTMGESIVAMAFDEKQVPGLDHARVKSLGEMIINAATAINENLLEQKERVGREASGREDRGIQRGRPLELIGEEMNRIKTFGSSLVTIGLNTPGGVRLDPRQIGTLGQMIVELAEKVTAKLNQSGPGSS